MQLIFEKKFVASSLRFWAVSYSRYA